MASYAPDVCELIGLPVEGARPETPPPQETGRALAMVGGAYDGASRYSRELASWLPPLQSADQDILPDKRISDARARDVLRNDAYVASGADLHRDNIVGGMYMLNAKPDFKILGRDEVWAEEFQQEVESKFTLYAESPSNWIDAARMNTLTSMVRLAISVYVASGEILASAEWIKERGRPFNTAIQMIDLDRLSNPNGYPDSPALKGGVHRNSFGAPLGYHIQMAHPSDWTDSDAHRWKYVSARKPWGRLQMIHIMEQMRPDQTRGIAAMVSALKELKTTKTFREVMLQNAVLNATFAASIESDMPPESVFQALGAGNMKDSSSAINNYANAWLGAIAEYSGSSKNMQMNGVRIPHLFPGTKLQLRPAGQGGPLGTEFEQSLLRYIAANLGVSYEQLSRDYSQTNYSSIRAAMTETWKYMQSRKKLVADKFATQIYTLWLEEAINAGEISCVKGGDNRFYDCLNAEAYSRCDWIGASRGQVDELKETQAAVLRLTYNLSTYEDEMARLGKDWRQAAVQRERENKEFKKRGIETDPQSNMMNAATGQPEKKGADKKSKAATFLEELDA